MIILDTNVVLELMTATPHDGVLAHLKAWGAQKAISAVTIHEIQYGLSRLPRGVRQQRMQSIFDDFCQAVSPAALLPVDAAAARHAAGCRGIRDSLGKPISLPDSLIAGTATTRNCTIATRNTRDFDGLGVPLINPWHDDPGSRD